jgi:hypothetical protein
VYCRKFSSRADRRRPLVKLYLTGFVPCKSKVGRPATHATGIMFQAAVEKCVRLSRGESLGTRCWSSENQSKLPKLKLLQSAELGSNWEAKVKLWRFLVSKQGHSVGQSLTNSRSTKWVFYLPSTQQYFGRVFICIISLLHVSVSWTIIR